MLGPNLANRLSGRSDGGGLKLGRRMDDKLELWDKKHFHIATIGEGWVAILDYEFR